MTVVDAKMVTALQDTLKVLTALRDTLSDVGERVNRLQEWVELELYVLKLANSFEQFKGEVRRGLGDGAQVNLANLTPNTLPLIANMWENCRNVSLMDLDVFVDDLQHLNKLLVNDPASDLKLKEWVDDLKSKGDTIQEAITKVAIQDLRECCDQFDNSVKWKIGMHRQRVKKEIAVLAEVSVQLRTRLDVSVPSEVRSVP